MSQKISKEIARYKGQEKEILRFFERKGYSTGIVAEYSSSSCIPLYVVYHYLFINGREDAKQHSIRLSEHYHVEYDIWIR